MNGSAPSSIADARLKQIYDSKNGAGAFDERTRGVEWGSRQFTVHTFSEFLALEFASAEFRVEGLLPGVGTCLILGAEKSGKSLLGLQLCLAVAGGVPFLGRSVAQAPTLLIEEEGAPRAHQYRVARQASSMGLINSADLPLHLMIRQQVRLDNREMLESVRQIIVERGVKLVVVGPLSQVADLEDENQAAEINSLMKVLTGLATELDILICLVHHRRKQDARNGRPTSIKAFFDSARGSSALVASVDVGLGVGRDPEDTEGWLFCLMRDEASFMTHYDFDARSLCIYPSEAPARDTKAPPEEVLKLLLANGPMGARDVAIAIGVARGTAQDRIDRLIAAGQVKKINGEGRQVLFQAAPALIDQANRKDEEVAF